MKIIYCLAGTFNSGGMERIVIAKANWLSKQGHQVCIVTTEQNKRSDFFLIERSIKRIDLDIMYSNNLTTNPLRKYLNRVKKIKRHKKLMKKLILMEKPDILISTFGNEVSFVPSLDKKSFKVAEIHFSRWYRMQNSRKGIWHYIDKYLTRKDYHILKRYNKFVCLTEEDLINWTGLTNVVVIPNFIDDSCNSKASLDTNRMIAVGRLSYQKGYDRMIEMWSLIHKKYPDWKLDIYGEGELEQNIQEQIDKLGLNKCVKLHKPTIDIQSAYLKSSALLLTSHYEGLPMVLLEAMGYGLPIIAFDCQCGPRDVIKDGVNGFLVKDGDIEGMANRIMQLMGNSNLRKTQGNMAFKMSRQYRKQAIMRKWNDLFHSLIQSNE